MRYLNPFIDKEGLIRVDGRLNHASVSFSQMHPIVLPTNIRLVRMIFKEEHQSLIHIGPQGLLSHLQLKYRPLGGRNLARSLYIMHCMFKT